MEGLNTKDFEVLRHLIDKFKKIVPSEMREHLIDEWGTIKLDDRLDEYGSFRKIITKSFGAIPNITERVRFVPHLLIGH
ncbi:hypothetical protein CEXT_288561 [Caerostris extrusa]|uniref:Uncharacterized protein n=1 Tax=Caerostris extrusa TaxID=172846 RepID=A0AAV4S2G4_CAEEX|nr:hypothetical protein CEXT_288561 [Caerostris extrusa]